MELYTLLFAGALGLALGASASSLLLRLRFRLELARASVTSELQERLRKEQAEELSDTSRRLSEAREELSRLAEELSQKELRFNEQLRLLSETRDGMAEQFRTISYQALEKSSQDLLSRFQENASALLSHLSTEGKSQSAAGQKALDQIGGAISKQLLEFDRAVHDMQRDRAASDAELKAQLVGLARNTQDIGLEANRLRAVLTNSRVRGAWGQLELRSIVESAGMTEHCDFFLEENTTGERGTQRPDMRVRLPNGLSVMIDAKAPAEAYRRAVEAQDPQVRRELMRQHLAALKSHIREMAKRDYPSIKGYGEVFSHTIVFLPNESLFYAAMEAEAELLNYAEQNKVILTTPLSLVAFLRAVAAGWTHVRASDNAREIQQAARVLHERLLNFLDDVSEVGARLESAVRAYNTAAGRQQNIRASFRRLADLGVGARGEASEIQEIDSELRAILPSDPRLVTSVPRLETRDQGPSGS